MRTDSWSYDPQVEDPATGPKSGRDGEVKPPKK